MKTTINLIVVAFIAITAVLPTPTEAKVPYNTDFCQALINESPMVIVEMKNFPECRNYWIRLNNIQKSYFRNH